MGLHAHKQLLCSCGLYVTVCSTHVPVLTQGNDDRLAALHNLTCLPLGALFQSLPDDMGDKDSEEGLLHIHKVVAPLCCCCCTHPRARLLYPSLGSICKKILMMIIAASQPSGFVSECISCNLAVLHLPVWCCVLVLCQRAISYLCCRLTPSRVWCQQMASLGAAPRFTLMKRATPVCLMLSSCHRY